MGFATDLISTPGSSNGTFLNGQSLGGKGEAARPSETRGVINRENHREKIRWLFRSVQHDLNTNWNRLGIQECWENSQVIYGYDWFKSVYTLVFFEI